MKIRKAFKYRLNTNKKQQAKMKNFAVSCRFVWNKVLVDQKELLESSQSCMNYSKMASKFVSWKQQENTAFLRDIHFHSSPIERYGKKKYKNKNWVKMR